MIINKIIFILIFFLLNSCGYNSILKNNTSDFSIVSIKIQDRNKISYKIKNSLSNYVGLENKSKNYKISIKSNHIKRITSRDAKGDQKTLELSISVKLSILENQNSYDKEFNKNFAYTDRANKFELRNYENSIIDNLVEKISIDINEYMSEL